MSRESTESEMTGGIRIAPACLVDGCEQPVFGREGVFCPGHNEEEAFECDGCGEMRHDDGYGESYRGMVHAASIDPPDEHWVCSMCVYRAEEAEIDRAEQRIENQYYDVK